jgi:hypothetical protein
LPQFHLSFPIFLPALFFLSFFPPIFISFHSYRCII